MPLTDPDSIRIPYLGQWTKPQRARRARRAMAVKLQPRYSRIALKKLGVQITSPDRLPGLESNWRNACG